MKKLILALLMVFLLSAPADAKRYAIKEGFGIKENGKTEFYLVDEIYIVQGIEFWTTKKVNTTQEDPNYNRTFILEIDDDLNCFMLDPTPEQNMLLLAYLSGIDG